MVRPVALGVSSEHSLRSENLAFDIDVWYPPLAEHTFHTEFLPLRRAEAAAIIGYHDVTWRAKREALDAAEVECLEALEARLDRALATSAAFAAGAFLRLCGRSPKDGEPTDPACRARVWCSYERALRRLVQEEGQPPDGNTRLAAVAYTDSWLCVRSGADAMSLLLTSERVFSDMTDWLAHGEPEQLVLREWSDSFNMAGEFRCYVEAGQLLGISQYDTYVRYEPLQHEVCASVAARAVVAEWQRVHPHIHTMDGSYVADFGVDLAAQASEGAPTDVGGRGPARLIELSPFRRCTGPALFAWGAKAQGGGGDARLALLCGPAKTSAVRDTPLQLFGDIAGHESPSSTVGRVAPGAVLRVRREAVPDIAEIVDSNWDLRWSERRHDTPPPYREVYARATPRPAPPPRAWGGFVQDSLWSGLRALQYMQCLPMYQPDDERASRFETAAETAGPTGTHLVFVYGTLKRGAQWHGKYLSRAQFVGNAVSAEPQALVVGECGVPYLLRPRLPGDRLGGGKAVAERRGKNKNIRGELYKVDDECLAGLDEYEGVGKNHYGRQTMGVVQTGLGTGPVLHHAQVYSYAPPPTDADRPDGGAEAEIWGAAERMEGYSIPAQRARYRPIHHIQIKQLGYLGEGAALQMT